MNTLANALLGDPNYSEKRQAWNAALIIPGYDSNVWRQDVFGSAIRWDDHGDRNSKFGWEIDHVPANALATPGTRQTVRALHWRNNASLGGRLGALLNRR